VSLPLRRRSELATSSQSSTRQQSREDKCTERTNKYSLPLNVPEQPAFNRETFRHEIKVLAADYCYDDIYHLNTQSGTQWDGFRHFAHTPTATFYNGTKGSDIQGPSANLKCSIHHWADHGIAGRGVLLDYRSYAEAKGIQYDPYDYYPISYADLEACGKHQGIDIRPAAQGGDIKIGDMLFIRAGWKQQYDLKTPAERSESALRGHRGVGSGEQRYAGVAQEERILDWLHDCYFASLAGDAPTFEAWPTHESMVFPLLIHSNISITRFLLLLCRWYEE
jgi:hypothetical protein